MSAELRIVLWLSRWIDERGARTVGVAATVALGIELLFMPTLLGVDERAWRAILLARPCGADAAVSVAVRAATYVGIGLLVCAAALHARKVGPRATWPPLAVCVLGLLASKVLKNVFARARPNALPMLALGHSFPSGHVMNTVLAALAVAMFAASFRHPRRWRLAAGLLMLVMVVGRVAAAHHWLLDVVGAALAAVALSGLALPSFRRRPLAAPAALGVGLAAVLAVALWGPGRVALRSPLTTGMPDLVEVRLDLASLIGGLHGTWIAAERRGRSILALDGAGTIRVTLPRAAGKSGAGEDLVAFAARPLETGGCTVVRVAVNEQALPPFVAFHGWREYRLPLPPAALRPGRNEVRIEAADERGARRGMAISYLRVRAEPARPTALLAAVTSR